MGDQDARIVWVLLLAALLALLLGSAVHWVTSGQLLVVIRRGVTHRTHGPGPALRIPLLERSELLDTEAEEVLTAIRTVTIDGGDVRVLVSALVEIAAPPAGAAYVDPRVAARAAVEACLATVTASTHTSDLPLALSSRLDDVRIEADAVSRPAGARVTDLTIDEIEVLYVPGAPDRGPG